MGVKLNVDTASQKQLSSKFRLMGTLYPEEVFRAIVEILFDIKLIAQKKIKSDKHIVTSRLRNSFFVKTPRQIFAKRSSNSRSYTYPGGKDKRNPKIFHEGGSGDRGLNTTLHGAEGAVGTNVIYGEKIEKLDSFLGHAVNSVDYNKRFNQAAKRVEKKLTKKGVSIIKNIARGLFR